VSEHNPGDNITARISNEELPNRPPPSVEQTYAPSQWQEMAKQFGVSHLSVNYLLNGSTGVKS
jgi:hypothetical protein